MTDGEPEASETQCEAKPRLIPLSRRATAPLNRGAARSPVPIGQRVEYGSSVVPSAKRWKVDFHASIWRKYGLSTLKYINSLLLSQKKTKTDTVSGLFLAGITIKRRE